MGPTLIQFSPVASRSQLERNTSKVRVIEPTTKLTREILYLEEGKKKLGKLLETRQRSVFGMRRKKTGNAWAAGANRFRDGK